MILIADSGSTKTSWALISSQGKNMHETAGFNPYFMAPGEIDRILTEEMSDPIREASVHKIYYYGSGCSTDKNCAVVHDALARHFPGATIEVQHDLLAAARALLGKSEGIACILGTGSNSCAYDGNKITHNVPSLGYMFGDEGSGAYIGRIFLEYYLKGRLSPEVSVAFKQEYELGLPDILSRVYGPGNPSSFMASFMPFLSKHVHHEDIYSILNAAFTEFFRESVSRYERYNELPVSFVGSVAYHFNNVLQEAALAEGITIGRIDKAPMEGLIRYHQDDHEVS